MNIDLAIPAEDAALCIEAAVGQDRLKVSAPLSGWVKGLRFRVTLPPGGIQHPYKPVASGVIEPNESGCRVVASLVHPWLGHLAAFTALLVLFNIVQEDVKSLAIGFVIWGVCFGGCILVRRSQHEELERKLSDAFTRDAV